VFQTDASSSKSIGDRMPLRPWIEVKDLRHNQTIADGYLRIVEGRQPPVGLYLLLDKGYEVYISYEAVRQIIDRHAELVLEAERQYKEDKK